MTFQRILNKIQLTIDFFSWLVVLFFWITYIKIKHILDNIYHYNTFPPNFMVRIAMTIDTITSIKTNSCYPLNSWWPLIDAIMSFDLEVILSRRQEMIGQQSKLVAENMQVIMRSNVEKCLVTFLRFLTQTGIQRDNWRAEGLYYL